ncbi:hypothetical protein EHS25_009924 [Saitozyma podzolica]|uniref:Cupin type-1 domain-containing protein n=1 Tax=Saitozyma podzolica TaxID=1890683 RepID=A0A427YI39_9TREE|nr:hypothetical protein EHS25_009924 [Saitozyma podzolica]
MTGPVPYPHPLLSAEEIEAALVERKHPINSFASRTETCMSDMVGMRGFGVHFVRLKPGDESTQIHYHLQNSEWIYILRGTANLQLLDCTTTPPGPGVDTFTSLSPDAIEHVPVKQGDFVGFQAGPMAGRYAHSMKAGIEGLEYLMGGDRGEVDVCCYPT